MAANSTTHIDIDVDGLGASAQLKKISHQLGAMERRFGSTTRAVGGFTTAASKLAFKAMALEIGLVSLALGGAKLLFISGRLVMKAWEGAVKAVGIAATAAAVAVSALAAAVIQMQSVNLAPWVGGMSNANKAIQATFTDPLLASFGQAGLLGAIQAFARAGQSASVSVLRGLGNFAPDAATLATLSTVYAQIQSEGKLTIDTLTELAKVNPVFVKAVAEMTGQLEDGMSQAAIGALAGTAAEAGTISAQEFQRVFTGELSATDAWEGQLARVGQTVVGTLKAVFTRLTSAFAIVGEPFLDDVANALLSLESLARRALFQTQGAIHAFAIDKVLPGLVSILTKITDWGIKAVNASGPILDRWARRLPEIWASTRQWFMQLKLILEPLQEGAHIVGKLFLPAIKELFGSGPGGLIKGFNKLLIENEDRFTSLGVTLKELVSGVFGLFQQGNDAFARNLPQIQNILAILSGDVVPALSRFFGVLGETMTAALPVLLSIVKALTPVAEMLAIAVGALVKIPGLGAGLATIIVGGKLVSKAAGPLGRAAVGAGARSMGIGSGGGAGGVAAMNIATATINVANGMINGGMAGGAGAGANGGFVASAGLAGARGLGGGGTAPNMGALRSSATYGRMGRLRSKISGGMRPNGQRAFTMGQSGVTTARVGAGAAMAGVALGMVADGMEEGNAKIGVAAAGMGAQLGGLATMLGASGPLGAAIGLVVAGGMYVKGQIDNIDKRSGGTELGSTGMLNLVNQASQAGTAHELLKVSDAFDYMIENSVELAEAAGVDHETFLGEIERNQKNFESVVEKSGDNIERNLDTLSKATGKSYDELDSLSTGIVDLSVKAFSLRTALIDLGLAFDTATPEGRAASAQATGAAIYETLFGDNSRLGSELRRQEQVDYSMGLANSARDTFRSGGELDGGTRLELGRATADLLASDPATADFAKDPFVFTEMMVNSWKNLGLEIAGSADYFSAEIRDATNATQTSTGLRGLAAAAPASSLGVASAILGDAGAIGQADAWFGRLAKITQEMPPEYVSSFIDGSTRILQSSIDAGDGVEGAFATMDGIVSGGANLAMERLQVALGNIPATQMVVNAGVVNVLGSVSFPGMANGFGLINTPAVDPKLPADRPSPFAGIGDFNFGDGDTATSRWQRTQSSFNSLKGRLGGNTQISSGMRGDNLGSPSSDHGTGRAMDLTGSNLGAYKSAIENAGGFAEFHGAASSRHLHGVPAGDTASPAMVGSSGGSGGNSFQISITTQPGQSPSAIADMVVKKIEDKQKDTRERS